MFKTIIPLVSTQINSLSPVWNLTKDIIYQEILPEDFSALLNTDQYSKSIKYTDYVKANSMAFYKATNTSASFEEHAEQIVSLIKFILMMTTDNQMPYLPYVFLIKQGDDKTDFIETDDAKNIHKLNDQTIVFRDGLGLDEIKEYANAVSEAANKNPNVYFMIQRFLSSRSKNNIHDKIVDLSICLETMLTSQTEISFQFALLHTKIFNGNGDVAKKNHGLLKDFYDARSKIVHGDIKSAQKKVEAVSENWNTLQSIAKNSMNYYFLYIAEKNEASWKQHLVNLLIGTEVLINSRGPK